ncbi:ankyrin-2 [Caerostris extrusa]|uniref:Ankyrin-2 n=1 Tax=Caerostris extrusa TaxID=172846 RepID=A0AAV4M9L1_CAEEX|nr:ankyrin-2 [Caerostris extrusa]
MVSKEKNLKSQFKSPQKTGGKVMEDANIVTETGNGKKQGKKEDDPSKSETKAKETGGKDDGNKNNNTIPRLTETSKSSSLDEGDVRLVIERKTHPGVSIKIKMKDNQMKGKHKTVDATDLSSTQGESDQSCVKDSGYISTSESVHKHQRSITIDFGHTTAKFNAGMKNSSSKYVGNVMSKERTFLPLSKSQW